MVVRDHFRCDSAVFRVTSFVLSKLRHHGWSLVMSSSLNDELGYEVPLPPKKGMSVRRTQQPTGSEMCVRTTSEDSDRCGVWC